MSRTTRLYSQHKVLVPHWVESLWFDLSHLDAPGRQRLLGAGAFLQLLPSLPEAELSLLLLLHLPWALAYQDSKHAVGVAVPWQAAGRHGEKVIFHTKLFLLLWWCCYSCKKRANLWLQSGTQLSLTICILGHQILCFHDRNSQGKTGSLWEKSSVNKWKWNKSVSCMEHNAREFFNSAISSPEFTWRQRKCFSGFTIPNRDIWKGLWWSTRRQNVAFSRLRVLHLTSLHQFCPPVLWLSGPCFYLITTPHFKLSLTWYQ